jgi:hypothetical protein
MVLQKIIHRIVNKASTEYLAQKLAQQPWFKRLSLRIHEHITATQDHAEYTIEQLKKREIKDVAGENAHRLKHSIFTKFEEIEQKWQQKKGGKN